MKRIELGAAGHDYIVKQLHDGNQLSAMLLALAPAITSPWTVVASSWPGVAVNLEDDELRDESDEREAGVVAVIREHLERGPEYCAIFEHALAQPSDPAVMRSPVPWFGFGSEVYFFLAGPGHERGAIQDVINHAQTYRLVGFLTRAAKEHLPSRGRVPEARVMNELATQVTGVIVLAWHGTGKVVADVSVGGSGLPTSTTRARTGVDPRS
jgi:hypothetical protein